MRAINGNNTKATVSRPRQYALVCIQGSTISWGVPIYSCIAWRRKRTGVSIFNGIGNGLCCLYGGGSVRAEDAIDPMGQPFLTSPCFEPNITMPSSNMLHVLHSLNSNPPDMLNVRNVRTDGPCSGEIARRSRTMPSRANARERALATKRRIGCTSVAGGATRTAARGGHTSACKAQQPYFAPPTG